MSPSLAQILVWVGYYKYLVIFPLAVAEGPIITVISGFLVSLGQLDFATVYAVLILGDLTGDSILYWLGKHGKTRTSARIMNFLGVTKERLAFLEEKFKTHPKKFFSIGKAAHGIGAAALFAAGVFGFSFKNFLFYNLVLTMIKSLILLMIGFYFGQAYVNIQKYLDYSALFMALAALALYVIFILYVDAYLKHENTDSHR